MKLKSVIPFTAVILLVFMQSCTVPNPYQPINNSATKYDEENENSASGNSGTGTTSGGTSTGITGGTSSYNGSSKSHNMGINCMNCHKPGGGEAPAWQVAGTVYDQSLITPYPNATVNLYTGPNGTGTLKYTIKVDARGNFYTSGNIDFTGGLYPAVTGSTTTNFMSSSITTGACNSCHNTVTMDRIWIK